MKGTKQMAGKISKSITIDSDVFMSATKDTENISKRIEELIIKGLQQEQANPKDVILTLLNAAQQLNKLRKTGQLIIKEEQEPELI